MNLLAALFLFGRTSAVQCADIVFSAQPYVSRSGYVLPSGRYSLYRIHSDGTGLRQLTFGDGDDKVPRLSKSGKEVDFSRSTKGQADRSFAIDIATGKLREIPVSNIPVTDHWPYFLSASGRDMRLMDRTGKLVRDLGKDTFMAVSSPSGRFHLFNSFEANAVVVDILNGNVASMNSKIYSPAWIDDDRLFAAFDDQGKVAMIDRSGKVLHWLRPVTARAGTPHSYRGLGHSLGLSDADIGISDEESRSVRHVPHRSDLVLLQNHHFMSDGGYRTLYEVDLHRGVYEFVDFESLESISADGKWFVGSTNEWIGGYKKPGSATLQRLYLWNTQSLKSRPIGPTFMKCGGACLLPL